jgi:two-component system sensor histidine kinase KdpD
VEVAEDQPIVGASPRLEDRAPAKRLIIQVVETPAGDWPQLTCSHLGDRVEIRVVDRGRGIPPDEWDRVFMPFQRLGDTDNTTGVGLGLALSRGLTEVMGGTLEPEETPGGGLTMVVSLPAYPGEEAAPGLREREDVAP